MFAPKESEDRRGPEGRPEIFDLNTYFHVLVLSEGAPVTRGKACFPAHLKVIDTFRNKVRKQAKGCKKIALFISAVTTNHCLYSHHKQVHVMIWSDVYSSPRHWYPQGLSF